VTAAEIYAHASTLGVRITLAEDGTVRCKAQQGLLTPELVQALRAMKEELRAYLQAWAQPPEAAQAVIPRGDAPNPFAGRSWRTWVTGNIPATGLLVTAVLQEPKYRDVPTPPKTFLGLACSTKPCKQYQETLPSGRVVSRRFAPTTQCIHCRTSLWKEQERRAKKQGIYEEEV
jgi:hypothetical protein